jgi:hypothetical protein
LAHRAEALASKLEAVDRTKAALLEEFYGEVGAELNRQQDIPIPALLRGALEPTTETYIAAEKSSRLTDYWPARLQQQVRSTAAISWPAQVGAAVAPLLRPGVGETASAPAPVPPLDEDTRAEALLVQVTGGDRKAYLEARAKNPNLTAAEFRGGGRIVSSGRRRPARAT